MQKIGILAKGSNENRHKKKIKAQRKKETKKKIDSQFIYYLLNQSLDLVNSLMCGGTNKSKSLSKEFAQNFKSKAITLHNSEKETSNTKAKLITCCIESK